MPPESDVRSPEFHPRVGRESVGKRVRVRVCERRARNTGGLEEILSDVVSIGGDGDVVPKLILERRGEYGVGWDGAVHDRKQDSAEAEVHVLIGIHAEVGGRNPGAHLGLHDGVERVGGPGDAEAGFVRHQRGEGDLVDVRALRPIGGQVVDDLRRRREVVRGEGARHSDSGDELAAARDVHPNGLRPGLRPVGRLLGPADLGGAYGLAVLAELHHIAGGVVGEGSVQGGDEAIGVEGERDAKGRFPRREPVVPSSSPRELVTPRVCGGCMTWVAAAAPSNTKPLGRVIRWSGWLMWFFLSFPR